MTMGRVLPITGAIIVLLILVVCSSEREGSIDQDADLTRLMSWMTGSFSSHDQAEHDSAYFDIRLQMTQIWPHRTDGYWLYVEQAAANSLDRPYRQRVYHLAHGGEGTLRSDVYTMSEPLRFTGAWREAQPLASLIPDSLTIRKGCAIYLDPLLDTAFIGSTVEGDCDSDWRGADYATSEVRITKNLLYTLDRGWSTSGEQVWGARDTGYYFRKIEDYEFRPLGTRPEAKNP
jgi:hypothetical protein